MATSILRLLVVGRDGSATIQNMMSTLRTFLASQPAVTARFEELADNLDLHEGDPDLVVVVGGDGTILRACRQMKHYQRPILGVNLGRLGFLADLSPDEFQEHFPKILQREHYVTKHLMFECTIQRRNGHCETHLGLNEVTLSSAVCMSMFDVNLRIDDTPVTTYSGDGVIVSTPVGSTAHSLSAGGPILRQDLQAFVITPICPHTLTNRPLVDRAECVYSLEIGRAASGAIAVIDGQIRVAVAEGDFIEIRRAECSFKLARIPGSSFYATLHRKLGWAGQPRYQPTWVPH
ncbi:MAG: NAD(+)/NADH kinase [Planctomycetaceae bacterium]|nr:NAD(+)/NADH kinase [Planctomycetaceae bacterium]